MNGIHMYIGATIFLLLCITMILAILGLSVMEDCVIDNECTIKHTPNESDFTQFQFNVLWTMLAALPIVMMVFMMYFMLFTKPDFKFPKLKREKK